MVMTCGTSRDMTKIDTFCTAKAELDSSFPGSQCQLPGFKNLHYFDMNLTYLPRGLLSQNHHERRDTLTGTIFNYSSLVTFLFFNKNPYFIYRTIKKI